MSSKRSRNTHRKSAASHGRQRRRSHADDRHARRGGRPAGHKSASVSSDRDVFPIPYHQHPLPFPAEAVADDCTVSVFVPEFVDPSRCAYLVYGPNGLMREVVVVRHGRYMRPAERSMLEAFLAYRESVGDDCLRLPEAPQGAPAVAMVTPLSFEHFDVARDAKRCVLVSGAGEPLVVLVVDAGGNLTDAMRVADLVDAALGDPGASEALAFLMRRRAVGDPFIEFVAVMAVQALTREANDDEL